MGEGWLYRRVRGELKQKQRQKVENDNELNVYYYIKRKGEQAVQCLVQVGWRCRNRAKRKESNAMRKG
jgi:hypothetical protein